MRVGSRWRSTVCSTEVLVVKAPAHDVVIECGGAPMIEARVGAAAPVTRSTGSGEDGTKLGKRYGIDELGIELLCTRAGTGRLTVGGEPIPAKAPRHLPSSD